MALMIAATSKNTCCQSWILLKKARPPYIKEKITSAPPMIVLLVLTEIIEFCNGVLFLSFMGLNEKVTGCDFYYT